MYEANITKKSESGRIKRLIDDTHMLYDHLGFGPTMDIIQMILRYAEREKRFVTLNGGLAYFYTGYENRITPYIDPFRHGYNIEMITSSYYDHRPDFYIVIPEGFQNDILKFLITECKNDFMCSIDSCNKISIVSDDLTVDIPLIISPLYTFIAEVISKSDYDDFKNSLAAFDCSDDLFERVTKEYVDDIKKYITYYVHLIPNTDVYIKDHLSELFDTFHVNTPEGMVDVVAAIMGSSVWIGEKTEIFTRDDVYRLALNAFDENRIDSYRLMEEVRKGRGLSEYMNNRVKESVGDKKTIETLDKISYLRNEADARLEAYIICTLAQKVSLSDKSNSYHAFWMLLGYDELKDADVFEEKTKERLLVLFNRFSSCISSKYDYLTDYEIMRDIISLKTTAIKHISDVIIAFKHVIDSKDNYFVSQMSLDNWFANFRYEVPKDVVIDVEDDMEKYKEYLAGELDDLEKRVNECCQFLEQVY